MLINKIFYTLKPLIPRQMQIFLRRRVAIYKRKKYAHIWPINPQAAVPPEGWKGWPDGKDFALVLSHDVDTRKGYENCLELADLEERMGLRSTFNFVPELYGRVSPSLLDELRKRGFDVAVHGLKHDGKLFRSRRIFNRRANRINAYLKEWNTRGFTSPSMHHNPDWLTALDIDYSISTFDTDPFEPQPDAVETIFPLLIYRNSSDSTASQPPCPVKFFRRKTNELDLTGASLRACPVKFRQNSEADLTGASQLPGLPASQLPSFFVELPYTLPQDSTLFIILQERTIDIWKRKLHWIAEKGGMVLLNTHPDYMNFSKAGTGDLEYSLKYYADFLEYVKNRYEGSYYHAKPSAIADFYKQRCVYPKVSEAKPSSLPAFQPPSLPLRVCMLAYSFYESDNRVRRYAETLVRRGDSVDVISLRRKGQGKHSELNGVKIYRIQERMRDEKGKWNHLGRIAKFFFRSAFVLTKKHLAKSYDMIHVHSVPDFEVFAAFFPRLFGAKVILDVHDLVPEFYASKFKVNNGSIVSKSLRWAEKLSAGFSDHVIISNHLWEKVITSRSVERNKCTTILNYPDQSIFYRRNISCEEKKVTLMYPGTLNWHQGLDIAIKAFASIKERVPEAEFLIYGDGPAKNELADLIGTLGLEKRIFLNGLVSIDEIVPIMGQVHIGIIPKRNDPFGGEAFSTKTLEFMSLGVPIIVSRTKIDSYYFNDSVVTFFEPENEQDLAEAMLYLIKSKKVREELAENAFKFVEKNNWDVKKRMYLDIVDTLVNRRIHS